MPTINEARASIYAKFITDWNEETLYALDNDEFPEPEGIAWVRLTVRSRPTTQETLGVEGNRKFLRTGVVFIQIFVPENSGLSEADRLAELVRNILEGTRFSSLWFYETQIREQGSDGKFYSILTESLFNYEQTK
jgi:hypothetical protein